MIITSTNNVISLPVMVIDTAHSQRGVTCANFTFATMINEVLNCQNWRTPGILSSASCRLWYECYHDKQNFSWLYISEFILRKIETSLAFLILDIFSALTSRHCHVRVIITPWILRRRSSNQRITVCHAVPMGPTKERIKGTLWPNSWIK